MFLLHHDFPLDSAAVVEYRCEWSVSDSSDSSPHPTATTQAIQTGLLAPHRPAHRQRTRARTDFKTRRGRARGAAALDQVIKVHNCVRKRGALDIAWWTGENVSARVLLRGFPSNILLQAERENQEGD